MTMPEWGNVPNRYPPQLEVLLATLKRNFTLGCLLEEWVGPDDRHSNNNIIQIDQLTLGLPSRDYFLYDESQRDLEAYHQYMTDVAVILGAERRDAEKQLWEVINFERQLANVSIICSIRFTGLKPFANVSDT